MMQPRGSDAGGIDRMGEYVTGAARAADRESIHTPGLLYSTMPAAAYAPALAVGVVAVEAVAAVYSGSYISWGAIMLAAGFWMAAAAVGGLILGVALLPALMAIKGRQRLAVMPDLLVALAAGLTAANTADNYSHLGALGEGVLLSWTFLPAWAVVLGSVTAWLVATEKRSSGRYWIAFVMAATLFSGGMSVFAGKLAACTLIIAPFVLLGAGAYLMRWTRLGEHKSLFVVCSAAALAIVFVATAQGLGTAPVRPIDRGFVSDPGKAAMLAGKPNVVIIVIDTLRADHTTMCGYKYPTTANLQALMEECQFFPNGESVDSWTLPSHASMFTGLYPREHGARASTEGGAAGVQRDHPYGTGLAASKKTLATYLSQAGYNTGAIAANYIWLYRAFGLDQGFSYYYDLPKLLVFSPSGSRILKWPLEAADAALGRNGKLLQPATDGKSVTQMGDAWIEKNARQPFFLFLNYMDAHFPYSAPPPYDKTDGPGIPYSRIFREGPWRGFISHYVGTGKGLTPALKKEATNQYDGGIAYADHWVGEFVKRLKARRLYDDTLLIVTSDHGEFLGEHARIDHTLGVYEEGVRIPILVKYPHGRLAGDIRNERTSIIDVFATVFDTLKLAMPKVTARPLGTSGHLVLAEDFENGASTTVYGSRFKGDRTAVYNGDWKFIHSTAAPGELYDLSKDAGESVNLASARPDIAARLYEQLTAWHKETPLFDGRREAGKALSQQELERLRSLGYLGR